MALTPASILADYSSGIGTQGATLKVDANNERVGIGTTNPQGTLQVGTGVTVYGNTGIVSATNVKANTANFSGNVSVGGVLTYEDVTNVDSVGIITARAGVLVPDGQKIQLGTGDDLQIYHDATDSVIDNTTGDLYLKTTGSGDDIIIRAADDVLIQTQASEGAVIARGDGQVELYYNNSKKLETTNTGTVVTGILTATTFSGNLTGNLEGTSSIAAISSSITDTAVDIFVYDTRKDSDGGAWRKRTQHTSWYNETLNTSTRGSRKEFPAVAVIVAESNQVTIYDGDDPDLPMWMVFNNAGADLSDMAILGRTQDANTCVEMLNGVLFVGNANWFATRISFISENVIDFIGNFAGTIGPLRFNGNIAQRNTALGKSTTAGTPITPASVNDVAMTVLPNAPIDDATGLPVPTIAVGTAGLLSVIRDDGSVVDYAGFAPTQRVAIDNLYVYAATRSGPNDYLFKTLFLSADASHSANIIAGSGGFYMNSIDDGGNPRFQNMTITDLTITDDHTFIRSGTKGIEIFDGNVNTLSNTSAVMPFAFITSTYNTGYMVGNIKGAFLSNTNTTNVTGTELVTNGTFATNTDNWTANGSTLPTLSVDTNRLKLTHNGANGGAYQNITTVVGETYVISADLTNGNASYIRLRAYGDGSTGDGFQGTSYIGDSITSTSATSTSLTLVAETTTTRIYIEIIGTNAEYAFTDNVVARLADPDRSVNNKGLQVFGTITKSAVATGADLVGYSGWSTSNNLIQPYNSDLNFGTGDFSFTTWAKTSNDDAHNNYIIRSGLLINGNTWSGNGQALLVYNYQHKPVLNVTANNFISSTQVIGPSNLNDGIWHHIVALRRSGTLEMYVDGNLVSTQSGSTQNVVNTSRKLMIGHVDDAVGFWKGDLALIRISVSSPSATQIKKIYEDEKVLFQENAKATIYGSSDSVTALAFDDDTNLLHVGTSGGRSDFQGLRRINNTTTAVTTAISASNDLVAEQ